MTNDQFRDEMMTLLKQLAADVHDMNTLAVRRERDRLRKSAKAHSAEKVLSAEKEEESGKGNLPPTPPIRVNGKTK